MDPGVVCLTWDGGTRRADLLVVPPETDVLTGARALRLCTRRGLPRSPQMVLAAARSTPLPQVPASGRRAANCAGREPAGRRGAARLEVGACDSSSSAAPSSSAGTSSPRRSTRGHDVATFTRGVSGAPPEGARALHGDRDDPAALPRHSTAGSPELVVDTSWQTRAAARNAAAVLGGVQRLRVRQQPQRLRELAAPARSDPRTTSRPGRPTTTSTARSRPTAERILGAALGDALPHRAGGADHRSGRPDPPAGLVAGPHRAGRARRRPRMPSTSPSRPSTRATSAAGWSRRSSGASRGGQRHRAAGMTTLGGCSTLP